MLKRLKFKLKEFMTKTKQKVKAVTAKKSTKSTKTNKFVSTSVRTGVYTTYNGKYRAKIQINGNRFSGTFNTIKAATEWRNSMMSSK
jgi:hypothetical protein